MPVLPAQAELVVVDDDSSVRLSLETLLRSLGFRVQLFASAEAFLLQFSTPACLIVDVRMRGMSGFELKRALQAAGHNIPTIFITALDDMATRRFAARLGAAAFLVKPFKDEGLIAALHSVFDSPTGRVACDHFGL